MLGSTPVGRAHAPRVARPVQTGSPTSPSPSAPLAGSLREQDRERAVATGAPASGCAQPLPPRSPPGPAPGARPPSPGRPAPSPSAESTILSGIGALVPSAPGPPAPPPPCPPRAPVRGPSRFLQASPPHSLTAPARPPHPPASPGGPAPPLPAVKSREAAPAPAGTALPREGLGRGHGPQKGNAEPDPRLRCPIARCPPTSTQGFVPRPTVGQAGSQPGCSPQLGGG